MYPIKQGEGMKHKISLVLLLGLGLLVFAPGEASASIGVKGGFHFATQRQGGATQKGAQMGFFAGVFFPMTMNPFFTVQPEVMIIQKGSKKEIGDWYVYDVTTKLVCIDAAVISKIHPFEIKGIKPCFLFGPYASFIIGGKYDYGNSTETIADYNKLEAGFVFGAGADFVLGTSKVAVDLRYNLGWTDVHKVPSSIWNRGVLVSAGFVF